MTTTKRRVLVTGASGLLGSNVVFLRPATWEVVAVTNGHPFCGSHDGVVHVSADLRARDLHEVFDAYGPVDAIIHTVAMTSVDQCERDPVLATVLNTELAAAVAAYARARGAHLVHISSDHIFDGQSGGYSEASVPHPINVYAATKLAAEERVCAEGGSHAIVRTNFFGFNMQEKQDLAGWMCTQFAQRAPMRLFTDVRFSPLLVNVLAGALVEIIERGITGTLHVAASDGCSKYDFGMALARAFGYDTDHVTPASVASAAFDAPRPKDMTLDTSRARAMLRMPLPTVVESIAAYHALAVRGYPEQLRALAGTRLPAA